jgi:hypothetical protein
MAYFKPKRNKQGLTEKRRLPSKLEGSSMGHVSLYDAFVESLWRRNLDEYRRKEIGFGDRQLGKEPMDYPDKEVWWDDPRSRLDLSREYHKYYSEEDIEKERLLKEETDAMERSFFKLLLDRPTPTRQWLWDAKRKARGDDNRRIGGRGRA